MAEKLSNFWYYYKYHVLVGLVVVLIAVPIIILAGGDTEPDIQIGYTTDGRLVSEDAQEYVSKYFEKDIQDVNDDDIKTLSFVAMMGQRIDVEFTTSGVQIMLIDGYNLQRFMERGAFEPLDELVKKYNIDIAGVDVIKAKLDGDSDEHIYALPMKKIKYLLDLGFPPEDYYLTVRVEYNDDATSEMKNKNAYSVLERMLEYKGQ